MTPTDRENQKKGVKARRDAVATLIKNHQDEFDRLLAKNRTDAGLPLRPQGPTTTELEERIRRQEAQLEKWRKQLDQAS